MHLRVSCMGLDAAKFCHAETCGSHRIGRTCALGLALLDRGRKAAWQERNGEIVNDNSQELDGP